MDRKMRTDNIIDFVRDRFLQLDNAKTRTKIVPGVEWVVKQLEEYKDELEFTCKDCKGCARLYNGDLYCTWNCHDTLPDMYCSVGEPIGRS